jgi:hypothetical protein
VFHEEVVDGIDEGCEIDWRSCCNYLSIGNRWFIEKGGARIVEIRTVLPPVSETFSAGQPGVRNDPWTMADRGDYLARFGCAFNEVDCLRVGPQRIRILGPAVARATARN